jgi:5-methylcytosine-specific restriction endonuclease McrA
MDNPVLVSGEPDPKSRSLARGERRRFRHKATKDEWARIVKQKVGPCRVCCDPISNGHGFPVVEFHHLVSRAQGGDDVADNVIPLCNPCHEQVTRRNPVDLGCIRVSMTDGEYAYVVGKLGEGGMERLFGVGR